MFPAAFVRLADAVEVYLLLQAEHDTERGHRREAGIAAPVKAIDSRNGIVGGLLGGLGHGCDCS